MSCAVRLAACVDFGVLVDCGLRGFVGFDCYGLFGVHIRFVCSIPCGRL